VTPRRFRLIATLNTVDRQFVNSLGQGLKRRFTFVTVDMPPPRNGEEEWGAESPSASLASREFTVVVKRAASRIARRIAPASDGDVESTEAELVDLLNGGARPLLEALFSLVEKVRYASKGAPAPHLPIGTAQLIDTVELFLSRVKVEELDIERFHEAIDWAASVKLAPLFDTETISPTELEDFASALSEPFTALLPRELLLIAAAGQHFVEYRP